ncbi:MAG: OmpA family protein [Actinomycetota bacterium]
MATDDAGSSSSRASEGHHTAEAGGSSADQDEPARRSSPPIRGDAVSGAGDELPGWVSPVPTATGDHRSRTTAADDVDPALLADLAERSERRVAALQARITEAARLAAEPPPEPNRSKPVPPTAPTRTPPPAPAPGAVVSPPTTTSPAPVVDPLMPAPATTVADGQERTRPNGSLPAIGIGLATILLAGLLGLVVVGLGDDDLADDGSTATDAVTATATDDQPETIEATEPLAPDTLPPMDQMGLVALELPLTDPYTGTGSSGTAQIYMNTVTGQVCHDFDLPALTGRYRAYLHQAPFPNEGPIVVDLGEVANSVARCVNSSPIDLTRSLADGDGYYVAAHGDERTFQMRGQLSSASVVFDNRDPAVVAVQEEEIASTTTVVDGSGDGLFGTPDDGAFLVVDVGRVTFEGPVPDEATAERLRAAFVPLIGRGVEVVDRLELEPGAPAPSGRVIVAGSLLFDTGRDQIAGDPEVLRTVADLLQVNPGWGMTITGHTDDVGPFATNLELSLRRANSVRDSLIDLGIPEERMRVQGAGPAQPIADNQTEEGRASNRRIELRIDS